MRVRSWLLCAFMFTCCGEVRSQTSFAFPAIARRMSQSEILTNRITNVLFTETRSSNVG
jgi:hypothetical protein